MESKYSRGVRVGNWFEEEAAEEARDDKLHFLHEIEETYNRNPTATRLASAHSRHYNISSMQRYKDHYITTYRATVDLSGILIQVLNRQASLPHDRPQTCFGRRGLPELGTASRKERRRTVPFNASLTSDQLEGEVIVPIRKGRFSNEVYRSGISGKTISSCDQKVCVNQWNANERHWLIQLDSLL